MPAKLLTAVSLLAVTAAGDAAVGAAAPSAPTKVRVVITNLAGKPVQRARVGQVLRFVAVPKVGRVCVDRTTTPYCAPPPTEHVLVRRVRDSLVVNGRVTARVVDFGRTLATKSIPASR
jgi:hypothetical protein